MIKLRNLEKAVKHGAGQVFLLRRIDLDVATGEFVTVMGPSGAGKSTLVADTLDRFGIVGKKDLFPAQLSGGQQQLVGVARALIATPKLLLADEPTGNLHSEQGAEIMRLFRELNRQGTTIVQVTHSEANAAYGNRVVRLRDGWLAR